MINFSCSLCVYFRLPNKFFVFKMNEQKNGVMISNEDLDKNRNCDKESDRRLIKQIMIANQQQEDMKV